MRGVTGGLRRRRLGKADNEAKAGVVVLLESTDDEPSEVGPLAGQRETKQKKTGQ